MRSSSTLFEFHFVTSWHCWIEKHAPLDHITGECSASHVCIAGSAWCEKDFSEGENDEVAAFSKGDENLVDLGRALHDFDAQYTQIFLCNLL